MVAPAAIDLSGRVAIVTGGASGIGEATVRLLVEAGARVLIADRDGDLGKQLADELGADAMFVETDVTEPDRVQHMVDAATEIWGRLDIAVNNAGASGDYAALPEQTLDNWDRMLAVNLTATFLCLKAEIPAMQASEGSLGAIVNTASAAGLIGFPHLPAYVAAKHGIVGLTKSVALEYARQGIRVNAVCPGTIRTPMLRAFAGSDEAIDAMGRPTPIGRPAEPDEVGHAILWLCSPAASYVTGHAFPVDGGVLAT
jgi:NAD(P)-dependent dehydrogenase (short-subunit alcohol dehydrogenase family)